MRGGKGMDLNSTCFSFPYPIPYAYAAGGGCTACRTRGSSQVAGCIAGLEGPAGGGKVRIRYDKWNRKAATSVPHLGKVRIPDRPSPTSSGSFAVTMATTTRHDMTKNTFAARGECTKGQVSLDIDTGGTRPQALGRAGASCEDGGPDRLRRSLAASRRQ